MEIKTKFNVGDYVYLSIDLDKIGLRITDKAQITHIRINVDCEKREEVVYDTKICGREHCVINNVYEKFCFSSLEDAQKEQSNGNNS